MKNFAPTIPRSPELSGLREGEKGVCPNPNKSKRRSIAPFKEGGILFLLFVLSLLSCTKEGPGGKAAIQGMVMHHSTPIPGAVVYIKYGVTESPGTDITYYDANVTADATAHFEFPDLKRGDYYLFGIGFDSAIVKTVIGGIPVEIKSKTETITADVPVTE